MYNQSSSAEINKTTAITHPKPHIIQSNLVLADTPRLIAADNFRDIAGDSTANNYVNRDGLRLRRGLIYRSNYLPLQDADQQTLQDLDIKMVYDLRTMAERKKQPDLLSPAIDIALINIMGIDTVSIPRFHTSADAIDYMTQLVRSFIMHPEVSYRFGVVIRGLIYNLNSQVFHCTDGKDRTGWTAAVIQMLLGVDEEVIRSDYLLTNTYTAERVQKSYADAVKTYGQKIADAYAPVLGVQDAFLDAELTALKTTFGSIEQYAKQALLLSDADIAALKKKMLVGYAV